MKITVELEEIILRNKPSTLILRIEDVTQVGALSEIVMEKEFDFDSNNVFDLEVDTTQLPNNHEFILTGHLKRHEKRGILHGDLITMQAYPVTQQTEEIKIILRPVID